jgi:hypothetical protein
MSPSAPEHARNLTRDGMIETELLTTAKSRQSLKRQLHNWGGLVTKHHNSPRRVRNYPDRVIKS